MAESDHLSSGEYSLHVYLQLSALLLSIGATAYEICICLEQLARLMHLPPVQALPLPNSITLSLKHEGKFQTAVERFEAKPYNAKFLTQLETEIFNKKPTKSVAEFLQQAIDLAAQPRRHWLFALLACVIQCVATCRFFGGDWSACLGTAGASLVAFLAVRYFSNTNLNLLLMETVVTFLASVVAMGFTWLWPSDTPLAMLFASIIWLVPGAVMMNSFSDLFHGFISSALHNFAKAWMILFAILLGFIPALLHVTNFDVAIAISPWKDWFWAGLASLACAYRFEAVGKLLITSFLLGAIGHGVRAVFILKWGFDPAIATFLAATGVGLAVVVLFWHNPLLLVYAATIGIIPLVPGALLLKAFYAVLHIAMQGENVSSLDVTQGLGLGVQAMVEVIALAIGGILPTTFFRWLMKAEY